MRIKFGEVIEDGFDLCEPPFPGRFIHHEARSIREIKVLKVIASGKARDDDECQEGDLG